MNLFTRTFSKIFKSSNQQELDKIQNLILAINDKEDEIKSLSESDIKERTFNLKKIVQNGELKLNKRVIKLIYLGENEIVIFFDKKTLDLKGWKIIDQYNNNINFSLNVVSKNDLYKKETFKIPSIN